MRAIRLLQFCFSFVFYLVLISTGVLISSGTVCAQSDPQEGPLYLVPEPGYEWTWPRDHANHGQYALEWWYYTGHLLPEGSDPEDDDSWAHFQLTFFRNAVPAEGAGQLYFAHLAISGPGMEFQFAERIARGTLGEAGSTAPVYNVWLDDWQVQLFPDGTHMLQAHAEGVGGIRLLAKPTLGPVLNGEEGFSRKGPGGTEASFYYSLPRMETHGWLIPRKDSEKDRLNSEPIPVTGLTWMDHEFGNQRLGEGLIGWDWWGLKLPGGEALMFYRIRRADGTAIAQSEGTFTASNGETVRIPYDEVIIESIGEWTSPHTGVAYPLGWTFDAPDFTHPVTGAESLFLSIQPVREDQELRTEASTRVTYYEGAVEVERRGFSERSFGFVELVGYDVQQDTTMTRPLDVPVSERIMRSDESEGD